MASAYYHQQQQFNHTSSHNNHHGGRTRRQQRMPSANPHRAARGVRTTKEMIEAPIVSAFRTRFEACKGFELDDDLEFCPNLLTEDDLSSISSSNSDRSSLSSGSPTGSPTQSIAQPINHSPPYASLQPFNYAARQISNAKLHQPSAVRTRSAIPIVDPSTMQRVASPPTSISPARMQQQAYLRNRAW